MIEGIENAKEGNLELGAIYCEGAAELYEKIGTEQAKELAKAAWLEAADAYEKLGMSTKAKEAYKKANIEESKAKTFIKKVLGRLAA